MLHYAREDENRGIRVKISQHGMYKVKYEYRILFKMTSQ
jgi:hypothetical protein